MKTRKVLAPRREPANVVSITQMARRRRGERAYRLACAVVLGALCVAVAVTLVAIIASVATTGRP